MLARIEQLAHRLRFAIDQVPRAELPLGLRAFPNGACGDASLLLGAYFVDSGVQGFVYVHGSRRVNDESRAWHGWLERAGLLVDITADQFLDAPAAVIVSANSTWHEGFALEQDRAPADFRLWQGGGISELGHLYSRLRPVLLDAPGATS